MAFFSQFWETAILHSSIDVEKWVTINCNQRSMSVDKLECDPLDSA